MHLQFSPFIRLLSLSTFYDQLRFSLLLDRDLPSTDEHRSKCNTLGVTLYHVLGCFMLLFTFESVAHSRIYTEWTPHFGVHVSTMWNPLCYPPWSGLLASISSGTLLASNGQGLPTTGRFMVRVVLFSNFVWPPLIRWLSDHLDAHFMEAVISLRNSDDSRVGGIVYLRSLSGAISIWKFHWKVSRLFTVCFK